MSVLYRLYQNKNEKSTAKGLWYAKAISTGTVTTDDLANIMQSNSTVKASDIKAVLAELVEIMGQKLRDSHRVKIDGLGSFKITLHSGASDTAKSFSANKNIKKARVLFTPETHYNEEKKRVKLLAQGATVKELPKNAVAD